MADVKMEKIKNVVRFETTAFQVEFDERYSNKGYITTINFFNQLITSYIIEQLESSKILKIDTDFSYYNKTTNNSSILIVPQFGFSTVLLIQILFALIGQLEDKYQAQLED